MTTVSRLYLLAALAIVVLATMSAPALATTITSNGSPYSGPIEVDNNGSTVFSNGSFGATCTLSNFSGVIESDGTGQITAWTFENCTWAERSLIVSVKNMPYNFVVEHTTGDAGTLTITSPVTMQFSAWSHCEARAAAGAIEAQVSPSDGAPDMGFEGQTLRGTSGLHCLAITWHAGYDINVPEDLHIEP